MPQHFGHFTDTLKFIVIVYPVAKLPWFMAVDV